MKNNYIFQNEKNYWEDYFKLFYISVQFLMPGSVEDSWILMSVFTLSLLGYVVWLKYMKKSGLIQIYSCKREEYFNNLFR